MFVGDDVPHYTNRIDTVAQLRQNAQAMLWSVHNLAQKASSPSADPQVLGFAIMKRLAEYSARRLALLKEFDLIAAAQVVLQRLQTKDLVVKSTYLLLEKVKWKIPVEAAGMSLRQKRMLAFAARYHGKSVVEPKSVAEEAKVGGNQKGLKAIMVEFAERYHREHSHL